ncbi:uncharacterized protein [Dermacentor albipictus]|uniref:uncharacterized protein isoform X2 n=1 Tax=Dermacentor albipictus TaxID=60249 RepID=UPI0038FC7DDE
MDPASQGIPLYPAAFHGGSSLAAGQCGDERHSRLMPQKDGGQWAGLDASLGQPGRTSYPLSSEPRKVVARPQQDVRGTAGAEGPSSAEASECRRASVFPSGASKASSGRSSASYSFRRHHSVAEDDDSSTVSVSSSSTTTSSAHCCTCNANNDSDIVAPGRRRRRSRSGDKLAGTSFPWTTCVPMAGLTTLAALLLLFAISMVVTSQRLARQFPATQYIDEDVQEKALSRATTANTGGALAQQEGLAKESPPGLYIGRQLNSATGSIRKQVTLSPSITGAGISAHSVSDRVTSKQKSKKALSSMPSSREDVDAQEASLDKLVFPFRRPTRPACGSVYYTFCERAPREFHYRRAANACVETDVVDVANVCNRGANRFSTLDLCLESCVSAEHPAEECFERPLFTRCARQDALSSWWQFEAGKCALWTFPSGGCPANGSAVFPTAQECEQRCRHRGARCRRPEVVACGRRHLRYPYFAHVYAGEGRVRCLRSSETLMQGRQCLAGANRFRSREACDASCKNRPPPIG